MPAIFCIQKNAEKVKPTEKLLAKSNKDSFGQKIGVVTNRATTMFALMNKFDKDSEEYKELDYRIKACQMYQQNSIDKSKGIIAKDMPKEWYDVGYIKKRIENAKTEEEIQKQIFNLSIAADKKPYFMGYVYPPLMKEYKEYTKNCNEQCVRTFGVQISDLMDKQEKTEKEEEFLMYFHRLTPLDVSDCLMNKICKIFEKEFDKFLVKKFRRDIFDYRILKTRKEYHKKIPLLILEEIRLYTDEIKSFKSEYNVHRMLKEDIDDKRNGLKSKFKIRCENICPNSEDLCNVIVDLCYTKNMNKQFLWDICGKQIIKNLLVRNDYTINLPMEDGNGNIHFCGKTFSMVQKRVSEDFNRE